MLRRVGGEGAVQRGRGVYFGHEVSHLSAGQGFAPQARVRLCFKGLSMGGHHAPDIVQEAHESVLQAAGCLRPAETLRYRNLFPLAPEDYVEGLMVDDRLGVLLADRADLHRLQAGARARDSDAFAASDAIYPRVGLETSNRKAVRRATHFEAWGAEVDGNGGCVGPPRRKLFALSALTADVLAGGVAHEALLESLLGSWAFFLQFRRPLFSLVQSLDIEGAGDAGGRHAPFKLNQASRGELALLSILGLTCVCDLRAEYHPFLFCTDASPLARACAWPRLVAG